MKNISILIPIFNDWISFRRLILKLDEELFIAKSLFDIRVSIVGVDDGSSESDLGPAIKGLNFKCINQCSIIRLALNLGHQRAIATGLSELANKSEDELNAVIVMDSDGEDKPEDVVRLIGSHFSDPDKIIVGERVERSEGVGFTFCYGVYKNIFRILSGVNLPYGNFSLIPYRSLISLLYSSDIWNHYSASISRSKLSIKMIPVKRGRRYEGKSKMNFLALVLHGLSAVSVYSENVAIRLILFSILTCIGSILAIFLVIAVRLCSDLAIPGWATQTVGFFASFSLSSFSFATLLAFLTLQSRRGVSFVPKLDSIKYIHKIEICYQS